jgi:hypothetical protein
VKWLREQLPVIDRAGKFLLGMRSSVPPSAGLRGGQMLKTTGARKWYRAEHSPPAHQLCHNHGRTPTSFALLPLRGFGTNSDKF